MNRKNRDKASIMIAVLILLGLFTYPAVFSRPSANKLPEDFLLIAHRGASAYAPEHTLSAFQLAYEYNADYLEIDLQQTKDGELIVMHDETLERTTNLEGKVSEYTYEELIELDAGSWFNEEYPEYAREAYASESILRLEELFEQFGKQANYYIETKSPELYPNMEEKLLELLEKYDLPSTNSDIPRVILQSFSEESLRIIHQLNPSIPLIQLYNFKKNPAQLSQHQLDRLSSYADGIGINYSSLNSEFSSTLSTLPLLLHVYTVNTYSDALNAYTHGADGIFTDSLREFIKK